MRLFVVAISLLTFLSCNSGKHDIEYIVECDDCLVSYWDEGSEYVPRISTQGTWSFTFEAEEGDKILVTAQSQLCEDIDCSLDTSFVDDALIIDSVYVMIKVDGVLTDDAKAGNREYASAIAEVEL